jgi:ribose transport system substrate-binding protein
MPRGTFLAATALVGLTLCGCGGADRAVKYRIAVIPKGLTHEFWQSIHRGAERAAQDLRQQGLAVQVVWSGPKKESDAAEQISIVDLQVGKRVQGIVLAPQHSQTMIGPVENAVQEGIPVVIIDSGLGRDDLIVKYIATDNYNGGRLAAEQLLKVLDAEGKAAPKIVLMRYQVGSESTEQRERGFEDAINARIEEQKKAGKPTISWLSNDKYAGATTDSAEREAGPLLTRLQGQGIDGIFTPNESSTNGMLNALRNQGLNRKVKLIGFDSSEPLLQALKDGNVDGLIVQDPYRMGYLGVWTLVQCLEGYNVTPDGKKNQSTGEYVITRENLDAAATRELFDPAAQKGRTMETPKYPKK